MRSTITAFSGPYCAHNRIICLHSSRTSRLGTTLNSFPCFRSALWHIDWWAEQSQCSGHRDWADHNPSKPSHKLRSEKRKVLFSSNTHTMTACSLCLFTKVYVCVGPCLASICASIRLSYAFAHNLCSTPLLYNWMLFNTTVLYMNALKKHFQSLSTTTKTFSKSIFE